MRGSQAEPADWRAGSGDLRTKCVRFARLLRSQGLSTSSDRVIRWLRALELLQCDHPADLFWSGRVTLVSGQGELDRYDQLFRQFWLVLEHGALDPLQGQEGQPLGATPKRQASLGRPPGAAEGEGESQDAPGQEGGAPAGGADRRWQIGRTYQPPGAPQESNEEPQLEPVPGLYSDTEILREKDFSAFDRKDEERLLQLLLERPLWLEPRLRSRRTRPNPGGDRLDLRQTVRAAVRWGGDPVAIFHRKPVRRWRKWVFLCDISASMTPYSRALLLFTRAIAARRKATEVFLFGTRLTRVTPQLQRQGAGVAEGVLRSVRDYEGGTRLGEALEQFLRQYGRRGMAHGADLFILSDGLDHGEAGRVAAVMAQLKRLAHRIIWVNPLKQTRGYAPEAQAMKEALPFTDHFESGHNLRTLAALLSAVSQER